MSQAARQRQRANLCSAAFESAWFVDPAYAAFGRLAAAWLLLPISLLFVGGCATVRNDVPPTPSFALAEGTSTSLGQYVAVEAALHPGRSGFRLVVAGRDAYATRAEVTDLAERTLDLQYYSAADDLTTDLLLERIEAAAQRGVRVRILLDDIDPPTRRVALRASALHPGIHVRLYNPFFWSDRWNPLRVGELIADAERLNQRMHNKLWTADNAVAIVGSRNLGDAYFGVLDGGNFSDVDLLAAGPVVGELSKAFDLYWNSVSAVPIEQLGTELNTAAVARWRQALQTRGAACAALPSCMWLVQPTRQNEGDGLRSNTGKLSWAKVDISVDRPGEEKTSVPSGIEHGWIEDRPEGARTRSELLIISPYLVFGGDGLSHLADMRRRGVRVAVLTNSLDSTDSLAAHAGYSRQRKELLANGVELFEMRSKTESGHGTAHRWLKATAGSLHAKVVVQDRARAMVGSLNQDPRSRLHNSELWLTMHSEELASELASLFDEASDPHHAYRVELASAGGEERLSWNTEEGGRAVVYLREPTSSPWLKFWRAVFGALIPEHLL